MCQQTSARPLTDPSEPRKVALGDSQERPRAPSGPPSDPPRSSPEPPSREYANGCRGSTNSGRPARAPGTPCTTQPQGMIVYVLTLPHGRSRLPAPSGLPPRRTRGVGEFDWAAPTAADPERESCGQQYENGPLRFLLRVLRRRVQPAANDVQSKMNHARDTSTSFQDDRRTRKCANRPQQDRSRTLQNPEK